jgi:hypothetical protein
MDWRVYIILAVVFAAIAASGAIYYLGYGHDPTTFFGAIFTAWIGGLALFVITGIIVAVISLSRPENESYDARARILFRKQTGKHIDYIIQKIKEGVEHYGETVHTKVAIKEYHEGERKFLLSIYDCIVLKSYLNDIETMWESEIDFSDVLPPPPGRQPNRLVYVRINNVPTGISQDFNDHIKTPISTRIERNGECKVERLVEHWTEAENEDNDDTTIRYARRLTLQFENLTGIPITIKLTADGERPVDIAVAPGEEKQVLDLNDVLPETKVYIYRIFRA